MIIEKVERRFNITLNMKVKYNLTMHLALMVERTMLGPEDYQLPVDIHELLLNRLDFYTNIKDLLSLVEEFYNISITDWEFYVLYVILNG